MDIHAYMHHKKIAPGQKFSVRASDLQMDAISFHAQVEAWVEDGAGDGFSAGLPHHESSTGRRLYDQIWLTRDDE